jgi:hypothetical protein
MPVFVAIETNGVGGKVKIKNPQNINCVHFNHDEHGNIKLKKKS